ncbi:hypothetical protein J4732_08480 [Serratia marcescens]|uniref:Uncharacterized protein n=1 Tax=Serratia marcescens TaxID=615 RepID=A0A939NJS3_SERMA|nr:hypothetical protein [Serratia marcescens]
MLGIVAFAFLPVPFSAVMVERQVSARLSGDFGRRPFGLGVDGRHLAANGAGGDGGGGSEVSRPLGLRRGGH